MAIYGLYKAVVRVCVCEKQLSQGFTCTQEKAVVNSQAGRLCVSHKTHTIDLSHKSDIKHGIMAGNYPPAFPFLCLPSIFLTLLGFMQYLFSRINREWKQAQRRKRNNHTSHTRARMHARTHARTHAHTHTHILALVTSEDTVLIVGSLKA